MKTKFLQIAVTVYVGAALLMFLTACNGGSSDPLKNYDIKGGPVTNAPSEKQERLYDGGYFTVEFNSNKSSRTISFVEGLESQVLIKVSPNSNKITGYTVTIKQFEHNSIPQIQNTETPGVFAIRWKPPVGLIDPGGDFKDLLAVLHITITATSDQRLFNVADEEKVFVHVTKNSIAPEITKYTLPKIIDEGTKVPFTIDVNDPASIAEQYPPEIITESYIHSNTEAFTADGRSMIQPDSTRKSAFENLGGGKWRFYYEIDATKPFVENRDRKGNIDPNASSLEVCFFLTVRNFNGSSDPKKPRICFTGRFAAQSPVINWDAQNSNEIKSGVESYFKFTILSANGLGKVEIKDQAKFLAGLSGTKSLNCEVISTQNSDQNCTLTWTPTCSRTSSNKKLSIKVENKINNKVKASVFDKDIAVLANEELCPAKKPATKTTQTNKGVAR